MATNRTYTTSSLQRLFGPTARRVPLEVEPVVPAPVAPPSYAQGGLIPQMKALFGVPPSVNVRGYCHGLGISWGLKMAQYKEKEHYQLVKTLVEVKDVAQLDQSLKKQGLSKLAAQVEFIQHPGTYADNPGTAGNTSHFEKQQQVDELMQKGQTVTWCDPVTQKVTFDAVTPTPVTIAQQTTIERSYNLNSLEQLILSMSSNRNNMLVITSCTDTRHTAVVFYRDGFYHLYNSNFETGEAKVYPNQPPSSFLFAGESEQVCHELLTSLFSWFGYFIEREFTLRTHLLTVSLTKPLTNTAVQQNQCQPTAQVAKRKRACFFCELDVEPVRIGQPGIDQQTRVDAPTKRHRGFA